MKIDKILHFGVSMLLVFGLSFIFDDVLIPAVLTISIGFFKEVYDHKFDIQDLIADVLGVIVALFILSFRA